MIKRLKQLKVFDIQQIQEKKCVHNIEEINSKI